MILSMQMIEELQKENKLFKEYIATLEKQIQANHEQRKALCRTMSGLDQEINTLNKRVSTQSSEKIKEAALQHFQEKYKKQCEKSANLREKLKEIQERYDKLQHELTLKQRRIQQLQSQNQKIKQCEAQKEKYQLTIVSKDQTIHNNERQIGFMKKQCKKHEEQVSRFEEEKRILLKGQQEKITHLLKALKDLEKIRKEQFDQGRNQQNKLIQQNNSIKQQKDMLLKQKISLAQQITKLKQQKNDLSVQNQQLDCHLKQAKLQVQQLSSQLKQYLTVKLNQKDKNKTLNPRQSQQQFNNAFKQLKIQISAIKKGQDQVSQQPTNKIARQSKQNIVFDLNSPSKWKSIESKLSLLRNTQSMNRFK